MEKHTQEDITHIQNFLRRISDVDHSQEDDGEAALVPAANQQNCNDP